jgi:hypothetical protein
MSDLDEALLAVSAARESGLPIVACMAFDCGKAKDRTLMGTTPEQAAEALTRAGVDVIVNDDTIVNSTHLFYKGSTRFNVTNNNLPGFSDDNAIAPDKTAYLPGGGAAAFSAVSSYSRGLNGLMVDVAGTHGTITANDNSNTGLIRAHRVG